MNQQRIAPAEVKRDEMGFWIHPDFPDFGETLGSQYTDWLEEQEIVCSFVSMEDDLPECLIEQREGDGDYIDIVVGWNPTPPAGAGWFLLGIWDTEDGAVALFARHLEEVAA
ncbi:TPA: hypothetical protein P2N04_001047 [Aeromonas salmonicida]|uniref:Uncharacterized protein n=1 Tax=Aeromonas salmonicida subsp. salmonicida TaxID=29491 RepID=A0A8F3IUT0_AERSS|nr:hypothetical protein [Aeromonas salmonicida]MBM9522657.1 hypothetical protein [Aeromonas salmonicida subsp. salmonicida]QWY91780.1 hypothetical protein [Aeromonas salmonicida subsp. salmonicida]HDN9803993.1 hypothetical protein [Aeromonas salmonicida]HDO0961077.1 hypothetical protein [Aeromonas salmonicida]HDO0965704.1 hypothetical protein [Aeromonas salmonicida]